MKQLKHTGKLFYGFNEIELLVRPYKNLKFYFTEVRIDEGQDEAILTFKYEITESAGHTVKPKKLEKILGDILVEILEQQLEKQEVVYYGGTGEEISVES